MTIYRSPLPSLDIPEESVFTYLFRPRFEEHPASKSAYIDGPTGRTVTRQQLKDMSLSLGYGLTSVLPALGGLYLKTGDTVLLFSPNTISYPVIVFGCVAAGLKVSFANPAYTVRELQHQWKDSDAVTVIAHPETLSIAVEVCKSLGFDPRQRVIVADPSCTGHKEDGVIHVGDLIGKGALRQEAQLDGKLANETAFIFYSSGTTGLPKGVETTHKNVIAQVSMLGAAIPLPTGPDATAIAVVPFAHVIGTVWTMVYHVTQGMPYVMMPKFDPETYCHAIETYKVAVASGVPPIVLALLHHPATSKYNLRSLKLITSGGAPLKGSLANPLREKLRTLGVNASMVQIYGMTETTLATSLIPPSYPGWKIESSGQLLPNVEGRLVVDGKDVPPGQPGELWIRGPMIMRGYLKNPTATTNTFSKDGWLMTGDVAQFDDEGFLFIVDRMKELIKYKGYQVAPAELESLLLEHPNIVDAAVIGVTSEEGDGTEYPRAFVVHTRGRSAAPAGFPSEVQKWLEARVAHYKFLRGGVIVVDAIPKSPSGKILRKELRASKVNADTPVSVKSRL